jgi:hypothetical protein
MDFTYLRHSPSASPQPSWLLLQIRLQHLLSSSSVPQ